MFSAEESTIRIEACHCPNATLQQLHDKVFKKVFQEKMLSQATTTNKYKIYFTWAKKHLKIKG